MGRRNRVGRRDEAVMCCSHGNSTHHLVWQDLAMHGHGVGHTGLRRRETWRIVGGVTHRVPSTGRHDRGGGFHPGMPGVKVRAEMRGHTSSLGYEGLLRQQPRAGKPAIVRCHQPLRHSRAREERFAVNSQRESSGRVVHQWNMVTHVGRLIVDSFLTLLCSCADDPIDGADGRHIALVTDSLLQKPVSDFPGKDGRILLLVILNLGHHVGCGHFRLAAANHPRFDGPSLIIPAKEDQKKSKSALN